MSELESVRTQAWEGARAYELHFIALKSIYESREDVESKLVTMCLNLVLGELKIRFPSSPIVKEPIQMNPRIPTGMSDDDFEEFPTELVRDENYQFVTASEVPPDCDGCHRPPHRCAWGFVALYRHSETGHELHYCIDCASYDPFAESP